MPNAYPRYFLFPLGRNLRMKADYSFFLSKNKCGSKFNSERCIAKDVRKKLIQMVPEISDLSFDSIKILNDMLEDDL